MPELAEVEYYRRQWARGLGATVLGVELHADKRIFRGTDTSALVQQLRGAKLIDSEARGKQMAFRFSRGSWLAIHLGMTGRLRVEPPDFASGPHDHLMLRQKKQALVFSDPRQFGRVLFFQGQDEPPWWSALPPALGSRKFTRAVLREALQRHRKLPIKAALLLQNHFPGVGNWMADEILWQARTHPRKPSGEINAARLDALWNRIRFVCAGAMKHVSEDFSDPPRGWFYHERWSRAGKCPRDGARLKRETIGGRTTAWCPRCQR
ncbi:MAG TPA: DNA-formamidopyrimidine glycosylase family protein [Methylomirabilota bacterium]|nr:DNA-formamidopyrimidine glycosylase family protein [Methylomirabilota bacterium]